ncbi:MAG: hypothetical protein EXX96DRAFT_167617 [Benjaminiella poitrasii]|nr:MAG: hypothetical protein EXX96DRAFT_167617 [Benjaminiella poitrasii]
MIDNFSLSITKSFLDKRAYIYYIKYWMMIHNGGGICVGNNAIIECFLYSHLDYHASANSYNKHLYTIFIPIIFAPLIFFLQK